MGNHHSSPLLSSTVFPALLLMATVTVVARAQPSAPNAISEAADQYLVEFKGTRIPVNLTDRIAALGGKVVDTLPEINVVVVGNLTTPAATSLATQSDVYDVLPDDFIDLTSSNWRVNQAAAPIRNTVTSAADPTSAFFFPFQWDKRVIGADRAWAAGLLGDPNVRVAVIDTGMDPTHPELAGLIDASRSISFCNEENPIVQQEFPGYPNWTDLFGHGTFTAAIASSNSNLLAGVTSRSTLMAIKALGIVPCRGSGIIRGIYYAADHGADVINISAGSAPFSRAASKNFVHFVHLAVQYAYVKGVSAVVVAAGNDAIDLDHSGNFVVDFCDVPGVICVSATGPTDSGPLNLGPFQNVDAPAFYTNFGASAISVAAPGGNISFDADGNILGLSFVHSACATTDRQFDSSGNIVLGFCSSNGITTAGNIGTSFAAPQVSGLAALLVSQLGHGRQAQVRAAIENSADDLGKPGVDPLYGHGRINVGRTLGLP